MVYIEESITQISENALKEALDALPDWRRAQALRHKHQQGQAECALSYLLLCKGLREKGITAQPTFEYGENGKPTLKEFPEIHFNISHCKAGVACAISECAVGVDIEVLGRYSERLAQYTMNAKELEEISNAPDRDVAFTRLWTMKEATMKLIGEGIGTNVRNVLEHSSNIIIYKTTVNKERGYVVTVAEWSNANQ